MRGRDSELEQRIPHDIEAEKSVLSSIFFEPSVFDRVAVKLLAEDFFSNSNREVFLAMEELSVENTVISRISVAGQLRAANKLEAVGGLAYLGDLMEYEGTSAGLDFAVDVVKRQALKRKLIAAAQDIVQDGLGSQTDVDVLLAEAEQKMSDLAQEMPREQAVDLQTIVESVYRDVRTRVETGDTILGVNTGFTELDEMTSGFHKGNLVILAARPSMGKTALALNIATSAALKYDKSVVLFSLEMSWEELGFRLISTEAGIDGKRLRKGQITRRETEDFLGAVKRLSRARITVDDSPALSVNEFRNRARRLKKEGKCDLILVDYLQLMRGSGRRSADSREQEIAEISRAFKAIAKELEVPVLALSQLNRALEGRKDKRPLLSDLRESGAIEQDADVIIFIYRDEYYNKESRDKGMAELIIGKQRNGPVGTVRVAFQPDFARFVNLQYTSDELSPVV